jgi:hypothetical protein
LPAPCILNAAKVSFSLHWRLSHGRNVLHIGDYQPCRAV